MSEFDQPVVTTRAASNKARKPKSTADRAIWLQKRGVFGAAPIPEGGDGTVPQPPVISIASAVDDTTPDFNVELPYNYGDYRDAAVGDILIIRYTTNPETTWTDYITHTLTAEDVAGTPRTISGVDAIAAGDYLFDAYFTRGDYASTHSAQIEASLGEFDILDLFANGEKGFLFDFTDLTKIYQTDDTSTPVTAHAQNIGRVTDLSGNDNHFTQPTAGSRPQYIVDTGVAAMGGNGFSNRFLRHDALDLDDATHVTVVMAISNRRNGASGTYYEVGNTTANGNNSLLTTVAFAAPPYLRHHSRGNAGAQKWSEHIWTEIDSADATWLEFVMTIEHVIGGTSVLQTLRKNGVSVDLTETVNSATTGTFGTTREATLNGSNGESGSQTTRTSAILLIDRALTESERSGVEAWMAAKNGVTLP
jgi:hypothetical protein